MANLHACRTPAELGERLAEELLRLQPNLSAALCLASDRGPQWRVERQFGDCPWAAGSEVDRRPWQAACTSLPVRYQNHELGALVVDADLTAAERELLAALLTHYGVALVNLTLHAESKQATEHYCASLQALEEGIVLFQEEESDAVLARLLSLSTSMMHAMAGGLYVLRDIGRPDSGLQLAQALGIPEPMLHDFQGPDGAAWPDCLVGQPAQFLTRGDDPDAPLAGIDPYRTPPILTNVVVVPLRYHGVDAGLCVLFNAAVEADSASERLSRVQSLGQLGAALLHRLQLEAVAAHNRAIARELQIAETIQRRLLPTKSPDTDEYTFAWRSIAAQYIGGDYVDLLHTDDGTIHATVADVSGHGINSALLMSSFRGAYRGDAPWHQPAELARKLNREVAHEVGSTGMFITTALLRIAADTRQVTITSAGHNPVLHYRAASQDIVGIDSHGPPLGFVEDATFEQQQIVLADGDVLLSYTDGVTEATDENLDMFGEERLKALLLRHAAASPHDLVEAIQADLCGFTGRERCDDDVSILVVKAAPKLGRPGD
jgi:serine phosphatase RsbU (regulator of sigma subunit)